MNTDMNKIKKIMKEIDFSSFNNSIVRDNKIHFNHGDNSYRCKMPSQKIQREAEYAENKYKIVLSQEKGNVSRTQLIANLKENCNIDIKEMERKKDQIKELLQDVYIDLASLLDDQLDEIDLKKQKKQELEDQLKEIWMDIANHLSPCIEEQAKSQYYRYLAFSCTEKEVEPDKWENVWKSFEEYDNDESALPYLALDNTHTLLLETRI